MCEGVLVVARGEDALVVDDVGGEEGERALQRAVELQPHLAAVEGGGDHQVEGEVLRVDRKVVQLEVLPEDALRAGGGRAGGAGAGVQGSGGAVREAPVSRARDETIASLRSSGSTRTSYHRSASVSCMRFRRLSCARQMRSDSAGVSRTVCSTSAARSGDTPTWRPRDASRQTSSTKTSAVKAWSSSETPCKLT